MPNHNLQRDRRQTRTMERGAIFEMLCAIDLSSFRITLVLLRTRRREEGSRVKEGVRRRVRESRQKEASDAADASAN